ncbi:Gldg family protein [Chitinophaga horti]|uniref:Gldg family protein n=1 Tax=Chitinophaga horti TaxID=2920382 RepID=A0ABY6J461_9BACT|nr:Gldg family protein [Chitinophaga horti]UYQ94458.1 Gldg family protein [Chitinophaga horti]
MKLTFRIAKLELSNLFYSPVAWVVLIIFMVQGGWEFSAMLERMERTHQMGASRPGITDTMFASYFGIFTKIKDYLYLYIPLLTMGLISRETGSGSIKLVYSSPVKVSAVVWGKYLAMVFYCMLLMLSLVLLAVMTAISVKDADLSLVYSGILGLFLQICAYAAIGLFMSSLTTYQVVAAISTLALLAGLNYVGKLWQDIDFVRDITYFLSISGRVDEFIGGLVSSRDVFYFLIVIVLFVGLTIFKLRGDRESKPLLVKSMRYALLIAVALGLGYITSRPTLSVYKDMTATKRRTLTPVTRDIVSKLKGPLEITTYVNLLDVNYFAGLPMSRNSDLSRYDQYFRFKPDIEVKYVYYYDTTKNDDLFARYKGVPAPEVARQMAKTMKLDFDMFLSPAEIKKQIDLSGEQNRLVRKLTWNGKSTMLRMFDDLMRQPGEQETAAALKRLVEGPAKAVFLIGHNERSLRRMGDKDIKLSTAEITFRNSLVNQGFDAVEVTPGESIPADAAVLVIADPLTPYDAAQLEKIKQYIDAGGNLLIAGEPTHRGNVQPVLDLLGVKLDDGIVLQRSEDFAPSLFQAPMTTQGMQLLGSRPSPRLEAGMVFPGAATLSWTGGGAFDITPLVATNAGNSLRRVGPIADSLRTVTFNADLKDERGAFPVVAALKRTVGPKEQRIIISGDADFMSNAELLRSNPQTANFVFLMEMFRWFSHDEYPVSVYREPSKDDAILVSAGGANAIKWLLVGVLPALIALGVAAMLLIRKRR